MISKIKKPVSILLSLIMVFSLFAIVPLSASAAENGLYVNNVYANTTTSGTGWSYNVQTNTLTLNNYNFNGVATIPGIDPTVIMYYPKEGTFTIELKGTNTIVQGNGTERTWWGIYSRSDLVITGDGTLNISTANGGRRGAAIYGEKNVTIDGNCTVNATSGTVTSDQQGYGVGGGDNSSLTIGENAKVTLTGPKGGTNMTVKNAAPGLGWTDTAGTTGKRFIEASTSGQNLISYKKVQFPAQAVASVTSGGTTTEYTDFATAVTDWNSAADGATLTLLADVTCDSTITVSGAKTLDLNGYGIKYTGANGIILVENGVSLTMNDSRPTATTHHYSISDGLASVGSGSESFTGGYITGGHSGSYDYAGGITIRGNGAVIMNGGTIIGNYCSEDGGGVLLGRQIGTSKFIMNGGSVIGNKAKIGGGVYCWDKAAVTINNGTISHNTNTSSGWQSGGILLRGSLTMNGGSITGNTYGINAILGNTNIDISGNVVIKDNKKNNVTNNINLSNNRKIVVTGELTDGAEIGIKMQTPGVFTASENTGYNDPTKFFSDNSSYAVHKNDAGQLYLSKKLIAGHTLSLDGNIGINFYLDPSVAGMTANQVTANNFSYSFAWANGNALVDVAAQSGSTFTVEGNYIKVTCHVCAAEMTCGVNASFTLGNKTESEVYSVRKYGDEVFNATPEQIDPIFGGEANYNKLVDLMNKMLDYGAKAQKVFGIKTGDPANTGLDYTMSSYTPDFDEAIQKANDSLADNPASPDFYGENFKAPSLVFLDYSTLKLYFENKDGSLSTSGLTKWNNYYYIKHENIAASQLDTLQTFTVSGKTFRYSALDYAKVLANSANTDNANLAKALYWYNQAANDYFG